MTTDPFSKGSEMEPIGHFTGEFGYTVGGKMKFVVLAYDRIPAPGAKIYAEPLELKPSIDELKRQRDTMMAAIEMVLEEVAGESKPYSADSYLPPRMVDTLAKLRAEIKSAR